MSTTAINHDNTIAAAAFIAMGLMRQHAQKDQPKHAGNEDILDVEDWDLGCEVLACPATGYAGYCSQLAAAGYEVTGNFESWYDYEVSKTFGSWYAGTATLAGMSVTLPDHDQACAHLLGLAFDFFDSAIGVEVFGVDRDELKSALKAVPQPVSECEPAVAVPGLFKGTFRQALNQVLDTLPDGGAAPVEVRNSVLRSRHEPAGGVLPFGVPDGYSVIVHTIAGARLSIAVVRETRESKPVIYLA